MVTEEDLLEGPAELFADERIAVVELRAEGWLRGVETRPNPSAEALHAACQQR